MAGSNSMRVKSQETGN